MRFGTHRYETKFHRFDGVIPFLEKRYNDYNSDYWHEEIEKYMTTTPCPACGGARLKPFPLAVKIKGKNIYEFTLMSVEDELQFVEDLYLELTEFKLQIAKQILDEIRARLRFLKDVGLGYLNLARSAGTLSGGEAQRIRLATQIGSGLSGVMYILDEPSIGLHQRDNAKLIQTLEKLRDTGNSVIVVEHDEDTMYAADQIIDIGPGAGVHGGYVMAQRYCRRN
jgi:excinuclease ABC subunit A